MAKRGQTVELKCITNGEVSSVQWIFNRIRNGRMDERGRVPDAETGHIVNSTYYLRISKAQKSHEGRYSCLSEHDWIYSTGYAKLKIRGNQTQ